MPPKYTCASCEEDFPAEDGSFSEFGDDFVCDDCAEKAYYRDQEALMESGPGPSLEQQMEAARKLK